MTDDKYRSQTHEFDQRTGFPILSEEEKKQLKKKSIPFLLSFFMIPLGCGVAYLIYRYGN